MLRDAWRLALGTLTAVPVRPPSRVDRRRAGAAMMLAPVAAMPLGLVMTGIILAGHWLGLSALVTAMLAIGGAILGNRAFHLDGLADVADGLAASNDRERSLAVMKSGSCGPAGVLALLLVVGLQVAAVTALIDSLPWWRAAVLAGAGLCAARLALVLGALRGVPAARSDGLGSTFARSVAPAAAGALWLLGVALLGGLGWWAGLPWWRGVLAAAVAAALVVVLVARAVRRFGGVTGDALGASIEVAFAAILVGLS
ncbi:MAG: adenosylcobinamide-GDP ribazoletransferase [Actinobacteria bacterium]|nr:adenosylcobinamide-GDP ribazoletransferase [Actinomycetota bacterium]